MVAAQVRSSEDTALEYLKHGNYLSMTALYARMVERTILTTGITATQYRIMLRLIANGGTLRIGELADMVDLGASAVTATVAQLVDMGAVIRFGGDADHRTVHVRITDYGVHCFRVADTALRPVLENIRSDFPIDLRRYASICTLRVARKNHLYGNVASISNVNTALCDEILLTSMLVSHITHDEDLSLTGYRMLLTLFDHAGGMHPNEVAHLLGVRPNGIVTTQGELLSRELITRCRDHSDRRAVFVEITSDGYSVLRRTAIAMDAALHTQICPGLTSEDLDKHRVLADTVVKVRKLK